MIQNTSIKNLPLSVHYTVSLGSWWILSRNPYSFPMTIMEIICEILRGMLLLCFILRKDVFFCILPSSVVSLLLFVSLPAHCLQSRKPDCKRNCWGLCPGTGCSLLGLFSTLMELPMVSLLWMFPRVCIGAAWSGFSRKLRVIHWDNASVLNVCIGLAVWAQQTGLKVFSKVQHWAYNDCHRGEPLPKVMKEQHAITHYLNTLWHLLQMHSCSAAVKSVLQHSYKKNSHFTALRTSILKPCRTSLL